MNEPRFLRMKEIPDQNIDDVFEQFYKLDEQIKNKDQKDDYANELVKLVTIIEQFFRCAYAIIFNEKLTTKQLPSEITIKLPLLEHIIELSKIYERPDNRTYFLAYVISMSYMFENVSPIEDLQKKVSEWNVIKKTHEYMFGLRHRIIHTAVPPHISKDDILKYYSDFERVFEDTLDYFHIPQYSFHSLTGKAIRNLDRANNNYDKVNDYFNKALKNFKKCLNAENESKKQCKYSIKSNKQDIGEHMFSIHYEMALIYYMQEKNDKAVEHLDKVLKTNPNDIAACYGKACVLLRENKETEAEKLLVLTARNKLFTFDICKRIIRYNEGKEQLETCLEWVDRGIYACPEDPRMHLMKYDLLSKIEMKDWAKSCLKHAKFLSIQYAESTSASQEDKKECDEMLQERMKN